MIRIEVAATSANCCLGFDSMGLALDWKAVFRFSLSGEWKIAGCPEPYCNEDNLVIRSYRIACRHLGLEDKPVRLQVESDVPFARGLGSSSTCVVAGVSAAFVLHGLYPDRSRILSIAAEIEGHPDNAAPAVYGGLISCFEDDGEYVMARKELQNWKFLAVVPDYEVETEKARKILPQEVSLHEAAVQVGRAVVLFDAMENEDLEKARKACRDVFHEPYRKNLIREYDEIREICRQEGALLWISGSGSTLLVPALDESSLERVAGKISARFPAVKVRLLQMDNQGVRISYE